MMSEGSDRLLVLYVASVEVVDPRPPPPHISVYFFYEHYHIN